MGNIILFIQFNPLVINQMNNYQSIGKIGQGAFSTVYKVKRREDGKEYAMKKMRIMNFSQKQISNCLNEVRILASISDPYILSYKDSFYDQLNQTFCIVTEYLDGGDIFQHINRHKSNKKLINENMIWRVAYQALRGLATLHQMGIMHRDIKSANLFLNKEMTSVKLADLNVSIVSSNGMARTQTGTPYYASPEVWLEKPYNAKCDLWSLGCVLYQMASLRPPFTGSDLKSLKKNIIGGNYKKSLPIIYSPDLQQLISLCLKTDPNDRLSAKDLLTSDVMQRHIPEQSESFQKNLLNCKLISKILAPRKRDFKMIKNLLPKNRFEGKQNTMRQGMNSCDNIENKQNYSNWNNSHVFTQPKEPEIKRSCSMNNKQQQLLKLTKDQSPKKITEDIRPPLPKKLPRF